MRHAKLVFLISGLSILSLQAQQNFINVPSSELTKKGKVFFQQQFNFNELIQANSTFDYGLSKGFEAGFNVLGLNYSKKGKSFFKNDTNDRDPYSPLITLNALKQFQLTNNTSLNFGAQYGINLDINRSGHKAGLYYSNFAWSNYFGENSQLVGGVYYNTLHYGGQGNRFGIWAGTQVPITQKFHAMIESVLGNNANCYTTVAAMYYPKKWLPITLGLQIPNTARNAYSVVVEFTFIPH